MVVKFLASVLVVLLAVCSRAQQIPGVPAIPFPNVPGAGGGGGGGGVPNIGQIINNWPTVPQNQLTGLIDILRTAGFSFAGLAIRSLGNFIPAYTTLMIPTNQAIADFVDFNETNVPSLLLYHAVLQVLPFNTLTQYPVGYQLPTMLFGNSLNVTSNSPSDYEVNNVKIVRPNMCGNLSSSVPIACHGIDGILDPVSNLASASATSPRLSPAMSPEGSFVLPPRGGAAPPPQSQVTIPGSAVSPTSGPVTVGIPSSGLTARASLLTAFVAVML